MNSNNNYTIRYFNIKRKTEVFAKPAANSEIKT